MSDSFKVIPRLGDKTVIGLVETIIEKHKPQNCYVNLYGYDSNIELFPNKDDVIANNILATESFLVLHCNINYPGFSIQYIRGGASTKEKRPSPLLDEIKFTTNNNQGSISLQERISILRIIDEEVGPSPLTSTSADSDAELSDLQSLYQSTVLQLEASFASQIEKITSWTVDQSEMLERRKIELADETNRERERLRNEFDQNEITLKQRSEELDQRKRELDDRDHMHARRAIRIDLQKIIASREQKFSLTKDTQKLRLPIHILMLLMITVILVANGFYFTRLQMLDFNGPILTTALGLAKQGLLLAALLGVALYYIRWMNRWFEDHATAEFFLKQFQLDVDRASWIIEAALEWHRISQSELPNQLLDGLTRNLFARRDDVSERSTAIDDLASALVGSASQMKVKIGDNEVSFDRKGLAKLAKTETASG